MLRTLELLFGGRIERQLSDIRYIQQLLGHESLSSTQIYTHVEIGDVKRVHARSHPRELEVPADTEWE